MLSCCCCCRGRPGQKGKILLQDPKADSSTAGRQNGGSQQQPDGKYQRKKLDDDVSVLPAAQATPASSAVPVSAAKAAPSAAEPHRSSDSTDHRSRTAVALVEDQPDAKIRPTSVIPLRSGPPVTPQSSSFVKTREPHEHQHGFSVFQSDDNEVTIVDSDYSDYESEHEDTLTELAGREFGQRSTATLSLVMPRERRGDEDDMSSRQKAERLSTFLLAREADCDHFGWETLPNSALEQPLPDQLADDEEVIVVASKSSAAAAAADTSTTAPYGLGVEDDPAARESLLALDQALAVFELASSEPADYDAVGVRVSGPGANPAAADGAIVDDSEVVIVPTATRNSKLIN